MKQWLLTKALDIVGRAIEDSAMDWIEKGKCRTFLGIIRTNLAVSRPEPKRVKVDVEQLIFEGVWRNE